MKNRRKASIFDFDWVSTIIFLMLVGIGIVSIYSATYSPDQHNVLQTYYGKQVAWFAFSFALVIIVSFIPTKFFKDNAPLFYLIGLFMLFLVLIFGANINGNKSWFKIGSFGIQPAEFVKLTTALGLAKLLSQSEFDVSKPKYFFQASLLILSPLFLILMQPDLGSAIVFLSLFIVLYRDGVSIYLYLLAFLIAGLFITTIYFGQTKVWISLLIIYLIFNILSYYIIKRKFRIKSFLILIISILTVFGTSLIYNKVLKSHQRNRIEIILRKKKDDKGTGYNLKQALIAISSGGAVGKGMLKGTQTNGDYIPEQHTDWILTVIGEQWGFLGTLILVLLYATLLIRLIFLAERQKQKFSRILGYAIVSILFFHYVLNMFMVLGLFPTIGIPLPFLSYGGSSLWAFTLMLFIFLKFDAHRVEDW